MLAPVLVMVVHQEIPTFWTAVGGALLASTLLAHELVTFILPPSRKGAPGERLREGEGFALLSSASSSAALQDNEESARVSVRGDADPPKG